MNADIITKKENDFSVFDNIDKTVNLLSNDIAIFLAEEIEELNISSSLFRQGMERSINRVVSYISKQDKSVTVLPDSIPGFTLMALKRKDSKNKTKIKNKIHEKIENEILEPVISRFFEKNEQKVMIIENHDIMFVLFPIADARKNLKDLELYITY